MIILPQLWALNSAVECHLHTVEVIGSNPIAPTILFKGLGVPGRKARSTNRSTNSLNHLRSHSHFLQECPLRGSCFIPVALSVEVQCRLYA